MCSPSQQPETLAASGSLKFYQNQQCGGASQSFTANEGVCQNVVSGAAISDWKFANTGSKSCGFYFSKRTSCLGPGGADDYFKPDPDDVDCYILDDVVASSFVLRCS